LRPHQASYPVTILDTRGLAPACEYAGNAAGTSVKWSPDGRRLMIMQRRGNSERVVLHEVLDPSVRQRQLAQLVQRSASLTAGARAKVNAALSAAFRQFQHGDFDAAVQGFTQSLDTDPANALGHFYLAETYVRKKNDLLARRHYQSIIDFAPGSKEATMAEAWLAK
jgi:Flp pilus assembly protein TadD